MERETGIEPATNSLEGCDSTTELLPRSYCLPRNLRWDPVAGSQLAEHLGLAWQGRAATLPPSYSPHLPSPQPPAPSPFNQPKPVSSAEAAEAAPLKLPVGMKLVPLPDSGADDQD
jgi:hypothetical protein